MRVLAAGSGNWWESDGRDSLETVQDEDKDSSDVQGLPQHCGLELATALCIEETRRTFERDSMRLLGALCAGLSPGARHTEMQHCR